MKKKSWRVKNQDLGSEKCILEAILDANKEDIYEDADDLPVPVVFDWAKKLEVSKPKKKMVIPYVK